jgi:glycerate-2-kinase
MNLKEEARNVFESTLKKVNPKKFLQDIVTFNSEKKTFSVFDSEFEIDEQKPLYIIGSGKAAHTMAAAMETIFGDRITGGLVITPPDAEPKLRTIQALQGSHPIPDEKSYAASNSLLDFIDDIPSGAIVFYLLSGGTSALFSSPAGNIKPSHFSELYRLLIESGASIQEINSVRKTVSRVKGGQLLERLNHTTLIDLIISDIPDDDLKFVGSGPTTAQEISVPEAISILEKYQIRDELPSELQHYFNQKEVTAAAYRTVDFENHHQWIVSSAATVAEDTGKILEERGFKTTVDDEAWEGSVEEFQAHIVKRIHQSMEKNHHGKSALVFFGECTVKVTGDGLGGRNQELALRMAKELSESDYPVAFLSCGTDGIDGPTDAAGAVVDQSTIADAVQSGIHAGEFIERNDSYHFFQKAGGHIITGPTGNNVMDIQIVLMD